MATGAGILTIEVVVEIEERTEEATVNEDGEKINIRVVVAAAQAVRAGDLMIENTMTDAGMIVPMTAGRIIVILIIIARDGGMIEVWHRLRLSLRPHMHPHRR